MRSFGVLVEIIFPALADFIRLSICISAFLNKYFLYPYTFIIHVKLILGFVSFSLFIIDILLVECIFAPENKDGRDNI